jgi:hypothetical protein
MLSDRVGSEVSRTGEQIRLDDFPGKNMLSEESG